MTLATVGVLISAVLAAPFARYALGLGWKESVLVGAMVASTDAAAVFFLIHARGLRLDDAGIDRRLEGIGHLIVVPSEAEGPFFCTMPSIGVEKRSLDCTSLRSG